MFLLKKAFNLRDKANDGLEKPFLEHLEDLRVMITQIVITLLISTIACYVFKDTLMDVLRHPIEVVWEKSQQDKLPETITPDVWEQAKVVAQNASSLTDAQKELYLQQFDNEELRYYGECAAYYRAALAIPDAEKRPEFIKNLPDTDQKKKDTVLLLLEKGPNATVGAKNNVVYMRSLKPTETFMLSLKLAFFAGIIVSFPFLLYFTLQFILPGLKENEKKALWPAMVIGFGLFLTGVLFCYFWVLPEALDFFYTYSSSMGVENEWRIGDYITFATQFTLIFGLAFELPVVVMTLVKIGLLDYTSMSNTRSYAIVSIVVIAAIITPTGDALTLSMLSVPMILLYEICIWLAFLQRKKEIAEEEEETSHYARENEATPRIAPAAGVVAAGSEDEDEEHLPYRTYEDDYDPAYFDQDPAEQDEDEGEEIDDGVVEGLEEDNDDDAPRAFGHQSDASDLYDPYEIDYNPGASADEEHSEEADSPDEEESSDDEDSDDDPQGDLFNPNNPR
ncbi:twin arginine targeting (Tat) protein translocase TatC [Rubritalea squalenifaciens DSM 18772]|uniref:Sec-independent protein translocase protein TatC n=1 Tax=Rubritalea squalenifaciens DSM 18772 TaxID=1123071 RepID=A0A1M6L0R7_9BACT|nr:twin-arginine translocase subunit TatC [Rubritalea squalenifaciens]SHJ64865.1 twin arginine targeting (Tat) protein translocase TatC [Rubritalea squalenifaciens DSM 18772]